MSTINFENIFNTMKSEIAKDDNLFTANPDNPHHIKLINSEMIYNRPLNSIEAKMTENIANVDQYSWNRDSRGGLTTGFPLLDKSLDGGAEPGLYLLASQPNVGKSALLLQIAQQMSDLNENVHVAYHSLDDSSNELQPRYISCRQGVTISQAKNPSKYINEPEVLERRNEGIKHLYRNVKKFSMWDANDGTSVEIIEQRIKEMKMVLPEETKIVIMIDSIYDLTIESKQLTEKAFYENIATTVKTWATTYDVIVMCSAHLKKLGGGRRPMPDDVKENNRLEYEANFIALLYNEVGIFEENASVYWLHDEKEEKMPVVEMKVGKNKLGSFKGTLFYEFIPDMSRMIEASEEDSRRYAAAVYGG